MSYVKSTSYPGWIYDGYRDDYISPSGRTAPEPGAQFTGCLTKDDHATIKTLAEIIEKTPKEKTVATKETTLKLVKTVTVGDVVVNWYRAS